MKRNRKNNYLLLLVGIIAFFNGCKTTRQATSIALSKMGKEERIESIQYQTISFNSLSSSLRFSFKPGMKKSTTSANAQLRIIKDKIIQLSLRVPVLGTEVARISITPEQIIIIDRYNGRYFSESIQKVKEIISFDFDFYNLQALLTNQLFIPGKSSISPKDYNAFGLSEDNFFIRLNNTDNQGINYDFVSDFTNRVIQTEMYKDKNEASINWLYKEFGLASNKRLFPMKMIMEVTVPDDLITMNLTFINVDIDTYFEPFSTLISNKYQPVEIEQVINLIQSF